MNSAARYDPPAGDADLRTRSTALHLILVDDHPIVRRGLRDLLADAFEGAIIHEVGSGREALAALHTQAWSVMVLDLSLPDSSGLDVLKRVRELRPRLPVLILSVHAADQFARRAFAAGASGYLTKDAADAELVTAVSKLARGGKYFGGNIPDRVALHAERDDRPHELLSDREFQVLRMIGSGKTVSEIATALSLSVKTVSTYRARVLEKMKMRTNAELTHYAVRHGLAE